MTFTEYASSGLRSFRDTLAGSPWWHVAVLIPLLPLGPVFWLGLAIRDDIVPAERRL